MASSQNEQLLFAGLPNSNTFVQSMRLLRNCQWYWGPITAREAETVLINRAPGTFLIRDSASDRYIFALSFRTNEAVEHTRLPQHAGRFCFGGPESILNSDSIVEFVNKTVLLSERGFISFLLHPKHEQHLAVSIRLTTPLSRLSILPSLKHQCRLSILNALPMQNSKFISRLLLPENLQMYLLDPKYLVYFKFENQSG